MAVPAWIGRIPTESAIRAMRMVRSAFIALALCPQVLNGQVTGS
jgi:hypothetical protein